jgi:hypothetical protein
VRPATTKPFVCFASFFYCTLWRMVLQLIWKMSYYIFYRCQIAVHQECYGARHVRDFTSWVCKACETPDITRECCLCPVKGVSSTIF